jgi:hypothetical protein
MDHNEYEKKMFDFVNQNHKAVKKAREAAETKAREDLACTKRYEKATKTAKIILWASVFLGSTAGLFILGGLRLIPAWVPPLACGVVGLWVGSRITALARAFE